MDSLKKFLSQLIFIALVGALVAFVASLFFPKYWQVSGKMVVFPSGKPASASQNLSEEVGNTAWIVNSDTFQERNFGDLGASFAGAEVVKNSSMVLVKFRSAESDIEATEDLIVKIPSQIDEYARDLYEGSPFKYKMAGDPEISVRPVRPNVSGNISWGFLIGAALYFFYWLFAESFVPQKRADFEKEEEIYPETVPFPAEPISYEPAPRHLPPVSESMPEIIPEEIIQPKKTVSKTSSAPDNLPIMPARSAGGEIPAASEYQEPSDEEVKDRLNKLMRGEL